MIDFLNKGHAIYLGRDFVILAPIDKPGVTYDYSSIKDAYKAHGGPKTNLQNTGGKA